MLLTDRTGVTCVFLATQVADKIQRYFARAMSELKSMFWKQRTPQWSTFVKCVTSSFALTSWHLFPQRSKAFLKILETIEIYLGSKMTSNKLFVTYERSNCSKSNPLADACFRVSTVSSRKRVWVTRGHFERVQAHLKFFPFANITKVMKLVNLAFFW